MLKTWSAIVVAGVILLSLGLWLRTMQVEYENRIRKPSDATEATHHFDQLVLRSTNPQGKLQSELAAPKTQVNLDENNSVIAEPTIRLFKTGQTPITITADRATVGHTTNRAKLLGNVHVKGTAPSGEPFTMETTELDVNLEQRTAETEVPAQLRMAKRMIESKGIRIDMPNKKLLLLNRVHGTYEM